MEDNSFDPRTWADGQDGALRPGDGPDAGRSGFTQTGDVFPLVSAAALRLWLASALVLALAAGGAWAMRGAPAAPHLAMSQAVAPVDHGQAPPP
jgi:hypothetical protein